MTDNNLAIWAAVEKTDPQALKYVNQRGGYTAIDANSQFKAATKQFGPIGIGWGFTTEAPIFESGMVIIPLTLWHDDRENVFGPIYGAANLFDNRGKADEDACKKATTDGLTKSLSMLGFSADVFAGMFDSQRSIDDAKEPPKKEEYDPVRSRNLMKSTMNERTGDRLHNLWGGKNFKAAYEKLPEPMQRELEALYNERTGDGIPDFDNGDR